MSSADPSKLMATADAFKFNYEHSLVPSPLSRMQREGVWTNVYRARVARATYSACQSDARIKSHDCSGMNGMQINHCACSYTL